MSHSLVSNNNSNTQMYFLYCRGIYFYDATWQPLEMGVSLEMEEHHQKLFNGKLPSECTPEGSSKGNPIG